MASQKLAENGLAPAVHHLLQEIEKSAELLHLFERAFREIPAPFQETPDGFGHERIRHYRHLVQAIDRATKTAPVWMSMLRTDCVIGCPMNEALIWFMNTRTGAQILARDDINSHLGMILKEWGRFLSSPASASVVHAQQGGWLSPEAREEMLQAVNAAHNAALQAPSFEDAFVCDPSQPSWGFRSWDDFFTRRFRPQIRPVACPDDDGVIVMPCESQPLALAAHVPEQQHFSLKETTYSFRGMLNNDPIASSFAGGTVFQGWLSLFDYHRWHAPVAGTVAKVAQIPGTYFAADASNGFESVDAAHMPCPDRQAPDKSQRLLTSIATRTVVILGADDARLGLVGFIAVGMSDVSSCVAKVKVGDRVSKGQEMGSFHYGGSSYCVLFQPGVCLTFSPLLGAALEGESSPEIQGRCFAVNSELARVA
ncbi:phosphatidylserine decarboxylase family protein [Metarhizium album ARSEF 1941]|uniref:Phosphatidylserine decarboxylase family protein n=1 Tax=Metarhizium album (strain ARSEF 1941) TaxID=1081103 RepID=A0A0B2X734_METAS|nr:phosphatidylserine decarboxylase family protein [Metarhizium album ARSEF 1941]KHO01265.1 phosphatidylserine decarboxylase family protein [Metarhizium album ARSEF 1941]